MITACNGDKSEKKMFLNSEVHYFSDSVKTSKDSKMLYFDSLHKELQKRDSVIYQILKGDTIEDT